MADIFKPLYKQHRKIDRRDLGGDVLDPSCPGEYTGEYTVHHNDTTFDRYNQVIAEFLNSEEKVEKEFGIITIDQLPGLCILPHLFSSAVQKRLVDLTLSKYVVDERHVSNLTPFYDMPTPFELFPDQSYTLRHKEQGKPDTTIEKVRNKQLRWITLGGQYDWTNKVYPSFDPDHPKFPTFPPELANLLTLFDIKAQAAIVNFYSPGDILSPHQDVAELVDRDLISVSIGCDCIFYCGNERYAADDSKRPMQILLRSGDVLIMGGESRKAWHGVGRVFQNSAPTNLLDDDKYGEWIQSKRVNINVRQMI